MNPETAADDGFRAAARRWLAEHSSQAPTTGDRDELIAWQTRLVEAGLLGVMWPREYGGGGLGHREAAIAQEEIERAGVPGVFDVLGMEIFGPTFVLEAGSEQKQRYLPGILRGEELWCQLFSEPAAGSDLAGVRTRARHTEQGTWVVNGQKVWTTNAQFASFGAALVRTDPDVPKHAGLTLIVIPMDAPGVSVRGLRQISGKAEFNEVFLDDVEVPDANVIGGVGHGWAVAMRALMFERSSMALSGEGMNLRIERFANALRARPDLRHDRDALHRLGDIAVELLAVAEGSAQMVKRLRDGEAPSPAVGLNKVTLVNAAMRGCDLLGELLGPDVLAPGSEWTEAVSFLPGMRSAGGTEEVLRNNIGERVLGLPPEPRPDKNVPFSSLLAGGAA
ncbi:acyl-CoA dehydrogenase [Aeromicrobium sp. PE09-221]|nr:acyl-CoA dehydrogenase [Aeromicrobium sp. PE09-221]